MEQTHEAWLAEAAARFGNDPHDWRFVCPTCGAESSGREFTERGAALSRVSVECIGRVPGPGLRGCDTCAFGLIPLGARVVLRGDQRTVAFDFAPLEHEAEVREAAGRVFKEEGVALWIASPNQMFGGLSALNLLRLGRHEQVLAAIEALAEGVTT